MKRIHVLSPGFTNPNSCAFLYPLLTFKRALKDSGIQVNVFHSIEDQLTDCDTILIEHKAMTKSWDEHKSLEVLASLNKKTPVIWCDQSDSTGTFLGQILPHVSKYLKAQILKDLNSYTRSYYGDRIYTDYYHQKHGVHDDISYEYGVAAPEDLSKLGISWNSGLMNHGLLGPYLNIFHKFFPWNKGFWFSKIKAEARQERYQDISCRMGISYPRATVRFQREKLRSLMAKYIGTNKLSRQQYFAELSNSKISLSPFGYGEITLKDFEVFLTGGMLLKPDMNHMRTWPNFYEVDVTYIAHSWDLDDVLDQIEVLLADDCRRVEVAQKGQERFLQYTSGPDAARLFVEHFASLLSF